MYFVDGGIKKKADLTKVNYIKKLKERQRKGLISCLVKMSNK
jgi:hypothetical protein